MPDANPVVNLAGFLARFAKAGAEAAKASSMESRRYLLEFFEDRKGKLIPKTVEFESGGKVVKVPLISITRPVPVKFESMSMEFSASVDVAGDGQCHIANHRRLLKRSIDVEVNMTFKASDPPEGFELIVERMNRDLSEALRGMLPNGL